MSIPPSSGPAEPHGPPPSSSGQRNLPVILAIIGILAAVLGVLYIVAGTSLPAVLEGSSHHGRHAYRAAASFVVAVILLAAAWLTSSRQRGAGRR